LIFFTETKLVKSGFKIATSANLKKTKLFLVYVIKLLKFFKRQNIAKESFENVKN
jgi:hypothetical protein